MVIISFSLEKKGWVILAIMVDVAYYKPSLSFVFCFLFCFFFFFGGGGLETYEQKKRTSLICFPSISKTDLGKLKRWGLFP